MELRSVPEADNTARIYQILDTQRQQLFDGLETVPSATYSFALYDEEQWQGGAVASLYGNTLHLASLGVVSQRRRAGLGRQLMAELEKIAARNRCRYITVCTQAHQALGFYQRCGFEVFGELVDCPFVGTTKYYLKKERN